jgi:hypothetical protein
MKKIVVTTNVELVTTKHNMSSSGAMPGHTSTLGRSKDTNRSNGVLGDVGAGYHGYVPHPDIRLHPIPPSQDPHLPTQ